jgi:putative spermidine/putrescine transport system substrate-binding protein
LAAGSKILGAPTLWAQNLKDVTIVHTGMSYSTIIDIATQATQDLASPWRWRSPTRPA